MLEAYESYSEINSKIMWRSRSMDILRKTIFAEVVRHIKGSRGSISKLRNPSEYVDVSPNCLEFEGIL